jgi:hypothetical protein
MESWLSQFGSGAFMPHGFCLRWNPQLIAVLVASNLTIALAYYSIPVTLVYIVARRKLHFGWLLSMFAGFLLLCGTSHIMATVTIWHGCYWLQAVGNAATALVSIVTALMLWPMVPRLLAIIDTAVQIDPGKVVFESAIKGRLIVTLLLGMITVVGVGTTFYQQCLNVIESERVAT